MIDTKIFALLALSLASAPFGLSATTSYPSAIFADVAVPKRASARHMLHQLALPPVLRPMGTYVGELQEKWQFPSDHLPIGMTLDDLHIASWNVLDAEYMDWVTEKNSQGLSRSMIADEHIYIGDSKLTVRDQHVIDLILQTLSHPTHPRSILSLQECSKPFLKELHAQLPDHYKIIAAQGDAILFDQRLFTCTSGKIISGIFADAPYRTVQDIQLRRLDNGEILRVVNVHLPGDPTKPGRFEFAQYLASTYDSAYTTIAMGDMNFNELEIYQAMTKAFPCNKPFSLHSPYCTNVSPNEFNSKAIDHFLVYTPTEKPIILSRPDQIMPGLAPIVALLQE